jgi:transmembrane sensor
VPVTEQGDPNLTSDVIVDAAQDWFLRVSGGGLSPADQRLFDRWHAADPRHRAAYEEVRRLWSQLDPLEAAFAPRSQRNVARACTPPPPSRRSWFAGWRLAVASAGAAMAGLMLFLLAPEAARLPTRLMADHSTAVGEQRIVELPDGSAAYLNTDTAIDVMYSAGKRSVVLLRGEALFEVRKDARRPFDVLASDGKATAVGTVFVVRKEPGGAVVSVTEGLVRVTSPDESSSAPETSMLVSAGESVSYRQGAAPHLLEPVDVEAATAWQRGAISIRDRSLAEALAEIGRYHRGRIVLIGDAARQGQVTARLSLGDLDGGIEALVATQGLSVTRVTPWLMLVR